jgi:predicted TIM-barrel fold metal-dependent hydrolase
MMSRQTCQSPRAAPRIDMHLHLFDSGDATAVDARYRPTYDASHEGWRDAAGAAGVRAGLLVQPSFLGTDNARLIRELAGHPHTLRGVAVLAADTPAATLHALHSQGVRGLRWNLAGGRLALAHAAGWAELLDAAGALGWHLELHTDAGELPDALGRLPDVPIALVIDHFGKPGGSADATFEAVERRLARHRVYVKLSAPYRLPDFDHGALSRRWRAVLGADRLLWGSDWPWTNHEGEPSYTALAAHPSEWFDDPGIARQLDANARELLGWPQAASAPTP